MLQALAPRQWLQSINLELRTMVVRCANTGCRSRYPLLNGITRRAEGLRVQGEWYCSEACVAQALESMFRRCPASSAESWNIVHRMPMGLLMMSRGWLSADQVRQALDAQRANGGRFGDWIRQLYGISEEQIASAVALQWSCPVFPSKVDHECRAMVPLRLQETYAMVPVHFVPANADLYVAFRDRLDFTALYAIEQMTGCHTEPCILPASVLERALDMGREDSPEHEVTIERMNSFSEMARVTVGYASQIGAEELRFVQCGRYLWVRVTGARRRVDLLFGRGSEGRGRN